VPETIEHLLTDEAQLARRRAWAEEVVALWEADRGEGSSEHVSKKGFTREELVYLADLSAHADDIRIRELVAHGGKLPGRATWSPGPEMELIVQALYREFGYIVGFLAFARECATPGFGFAGRGAKSFRPDASDGTRATMTPRVVDRFMRNPFFVAHVRDDAARRGVAPGWKDVVSLIEKLGVFAPTPTLLRELGRDRGTGLGKRRRNPGVEV
jgi:hypothetical protein